MKIDQNSKRITIGINASFARKPNTGIGQVTLNFLRKLSEYKVEGSKYKAKYKFILYLEEDLPKEFALPENFEKKIFLPLWKRDDLIRRIWWEKYLLPKKAKKDGCDIFLSLYQCPTVNFTRHIMVVHDIIPRFFPEYLNNSRKTLYWRWTEQAIQKADKIIAISKRTEKDLIEQLDLEAGNVTVNYIAADEIYKKRIEDHRLKIILEKYDLRPGYILAGGGYEVRKNVEGVIRAYKLLLERNQNEHFFQGEFPRLAVYGKLLPQLAPLATDAEKLIKELNLTEHIKLLKMVPQKDLPAVFQNAAMFVYPSRYEGFGLPVLEAMHCGVPVITSKTASLPEVGGDSVLYCDPNDIHDIAMVMKNLLLNKNLRETLKARGPERAQQFNWDKFTEKILNITFESFKKIMIAYERYKY